MNSALDDFFSKVAASLAPFAAALNNATNATNVFGSGVLAAVAELGASMATGLAEVAGALAGFSASLLSTTAAVLTAAAAATAQALADFTVAGILSGGLTAVLGVVIAAFTALAAAVAAAAAALVAAFAAAAAAVAAVFVAPLIVAGTALTAAVVALTAPFAAVGAAVSSVVAPFIAVGAAARAITAPFTLLQGAIGPFVEALNPAVMQLFNYSLKTLQATIGVAFLPLMQVMAGAMQKFAGAILPLMQALAPILGDLASVLTSAMLPIIQTVADTFLAMTPLIQFVVDILGAMGEGMQAFAVVLRTVIGVLMDFLAGLFGGGGLKTAAAQFSDAIRRMTTAVVVGIAQLAVAFGQLGFIDKLVKNLGAVIRPAQGAVPAPSNVGIKGFEQIGKDAAMAAFAAQGGGGAKEKGTNDWLKDVAEQLKDIKEGKAAQPEWVKDVLEFIKTATEIKDKIITWFGSLDNFIEWVKQHWPRLPNVAGRAASAAADAAGGAFRAVNGAAG